MIALLSFVLVALIVLRAGLRRAPLLTLVCLGIVGFGLHSGVIALPSAVTRPVAHLSSDVRTWQRTQAARLACEADEASALRSEDPAALDRVWQSCGSGGVTEQ
jgi:hypothetical protein